MYHNFSDTSNIKEIIMSVYTVVVYDLHTLRITSTLLDMPTIVCITDELFNVYKHYYINSLMFAYCTYIITYSTPITLRTVLIET